jgi:hypothetical protein
LAGLDQTGKEAVGEEIAKELREVESPSGFEAAN